ncbi:hypothetical protein J7I80_15075 [Bacillus sp. ISL-41]|uniref:hypothetical protein n=1 Tax=Bacillus sp. ISL-41 TaxID=2819127 RepID=UPI001BE8EEBF|nr:hypothetical protein [Bacillus sp. ISL-41]MBT2643562.1 hypothetical protein [Bacillus sp. ISL-41]
MKKKIVMLLTAALFFTIFAAYLVGWKDSRKLRVIESEYADLEWFNKQIQLNNEVQISYSQGELSKETVEVSLSSLQNAYQLYLPNETERSKEIDELWARYWSVTTKDRMAEYDLSVLQDIGTELTKIERDMASEVSVLREKQNNYWWK